VVSGVFEGECATPRILYSTWGAASLDTITILFMRIRTYMNTSSLYNHSSFRALLRRSALRMSAPGRPRRIRLGAFVVQRRPLMPVSRAF